MTVKANYFICIILSALSLDCFAQFKITDSVAMGSYEDAIRSYDLLKSEVLFQDTSFTVRRTCSGEWGGSIWFKDNISGEEYSCSATCPVVINKLNNKYYVTASLNHLMGSTEVIEIEDPESMEIFIMPEPAVKKGKQKIYYVGDSESKSRVGATVIVDSVGVLTAGSFVHRGELLHVVGTRKGAFLSKVNNGHFQSILTISNDELFFSPSATFRTKDSVLIMPFTHNKQRGFVLVEGEEIRINRFE